MIPPLQHPRLRLGDRYLEQLLTARANPLVNFRLARLCLYYSGSETGEDAGLVSELVLQPHLRGTTLERDQLVLLVRDVVDRVSARPGTYSLRLLSCTGRAFGTMTFETITPLGAGATKPRATSPEAPLRVALAGRADSWSLGRVVRGVLAATSRWRSG